MSLNTMRSWCWFECESRQTWWPSRVAMESQRMEVVSRLGGGWWMELEAAVEKQ